MPDPEYLTAQELDRIAARADFARDKAAGRQARTDMRHGKEGGVSGYVDKKLAAIFARQSKRRMKR